MIAHRLTGARCRCTKCGEVFNSVSTFNRHHVGSWQGRGALRRCLTIDEMVSRGWSVNARRFWIERQRIDTNSTSDDLIAPLTRRAA